MNCLFIGLGSIARKHIVALRQLDSRCVIQALRSSNHESSPSIDAVENIFSLEQATAPDFVVISNPTALHRETIEKVLQLKCPLFIEKPLFHTCSAADEALVQTLMQRAVRTYVACNLRFHPAILFLKTWLQQTQAQVQEVNVYCGSYLPHWRPGSDFRASYSANPALGGGVHLDLIHELDYICYLFGKPAVAYARKTSTSLLNIESVDAAYYTLGYEGFTISLSLNYFRPLPKRTIEIVCDGKIIVVDLIKATITDIVSNSVLFQKEDYTIMDTYYDQMKYFIGNNARRMMNDVSEAYEILKIALS